MKQTRISIAKQDIVRLFEQYPENVFDLATLQEILAQNRTSWRLAATMSCSDFIKYMLSKTRLKAHRFDFSYRPIVRYTWGQVPLYELLLSLKPDSYFTHYTAMYFHELTEQSPETIYINIEQDAKPRPQGTLAQERIDAAFKRPTRISNNVAHYAGRLIRMLNGMCTGNLGVIEMGRPKGEKVRLTDVERTLLDITVRPEYAGGVYEVLKAYRIAKDKVSVNRLVATLKKINYVYPYHQAVGFYLDRAGVYSPSQVDLLGKFERKFDFYLMHNTKESEYSARWRLYFPKGFG